MSICELHSRITETLGQRDSVWERLGRADRAAAMGAPPIEMIGLSHAYCSAVAWWRDLTLVSEASAAQGQPRRAAPGQSPESYDNIVLTGLRYELETVQSSIDRYRVEIEKKFAIAAACVVFVLLGAPIALRFPRGGVGLTIGASLGVFAIYYVGLLAGEALADRALLDPTIAMWGTNFLLGVVGIVLTIRLGSEGSTSRGSETSEWWGRTWDAWRTRFRRQGTA
jgi:hypothetical protein